MEVDEGIALCCRRASEEQQMRRRIKLMHVHDTKAFSTNVPRFLFEGIVHVGNRKTIL